ncbi:valine--tRNA ligase, partial [Aplysia californica]|uniref:valine--tRNA ligase n=1 Tax=Aplysia californica TaxID=6500 RepID=A0ABM1AF29_APLCA
MVMMSLELTGKLPFDTVMLHGLLRDAQGRKMSKSLGNVIDPMDVIDGRSLEDLEARLCAGNLDPREVARAREGQRLAYPEGIARCGADALRITLLAYNVKNLDINFNVAHAESNKRFCNKIWQSFKFILSKIGDGPFQSTDFKLTGQEDSTDLWILSQLSHMVHVCHAHFEAYDLHLVVEALHQFWYRDLCDVYLESVKPV